MPPLILHTQAPAHVYTHTCTHTHTHMHKIQHHSGFHEKYSKKTRDNQTLLKKQSCGITVLECLWRSCAHLDLGHCIQDFWFTCCEHLADPWQLEKVATFIFSQPPVIDTPPLESRTTKKSPESLKGTTHFSPLFLNPSGYHS